jgi:molecular chaperone HscA
MLKDSMAHAADDRDVRRLREEQVEADRVLEALAAALAADGEALLEPAERAPVDAAAERLAAARDGDNYRDIRAAIEAVEKASAVFVERRMNSSIRAAMAGHKVDEFSD